MKCQLCQVFVRILEDVKEKENKIMAKKTPINLPMS